MFVWSCIMPTIEPKGLNTSCPLSDVITFVGFITSQVSKHDKLLPLYCVSNVEFYFYGKARPYQRFTNHQLLGCLFVPTWHHQRASIGKSKEKVGNYFNTTIQGQQRYFNTLIEVHETKTPTRPKLVISCRFQPTPHLLVRAHH